MFADIVDSTLLYGSLGDELAEARINNSLRRASAISIKHDGRVVKMIGDEIMCCFASPDQAVKTAIQLQQEFTNDEIVFRIGIHFGDVIEKTDDLFGDTVNTASRMAGIAGKHQIITTHTLISKLDKDLSRYIRLFDKTKLKGKEEQQDIYQIAWEQDSRITEVFSLQDTLETLDSSVMLVLQYSDQEQVISNNEVDAPVSLGRGGCDIKVKSNCASRLHADLDFRRGKFVLIDHSTNGTYVRFNGQDEVFIRREDIPLMGEGTISLGETTNEGSDHKINFRILHND